MQDKMKKVIKKYNKVSSSETVESLSKFKFQDKPNELEEARKDLYGHYLSIFKIHLFINMQIHGFFLTSPKNTHLENINLRFFLLNIFETSNDFYKHSLKINNINKSLDIQCTIIGSESGESTIQSDFKALEHIFLILFFSLISESLLDNVEMFCEFSQENFVKISINFCKEKSLLQTKKNVANEVVLFMTDKIFELTSLPEDVFFQKISENLKKYKIYEIGLNALLFNLKQLKATNFQIQDQSSENQLVSSVSFFLPILIKNQVIHNHSPNVNEHNFLKSNSAFRFLEHNKMNKHVFILETFSVKSSRNLLDFKLNDINDKIFSPLSSENKKQLSEEFMKFEKKNDDSPVEKEIESIAEFRNKQLKISSQVIKIQISINKEPGGENNGAEEKKIDLDGNLPKDKVNFIII